MFRRRREDSAKDCSDEVVHPPHNQVYKYLITLLRFASISNVLQYILLLVVAQVVCPVENTGGGRGEPGGLRVGGNCSRQVWQF